MTPPSADELSLISARIPKDLADWVTNEFPHGFKQQFIQQCFLSLRHLIIEGELPPPSDYARLASVEAIIEMNK
jgi:hypothetical protein